MQTPIPSFCVFINLAVPVGELPECTQETMTDLTKNYFQHFIPDPLTSKSSTPHRRWYMAEVKTEAFQVSSN